MIGIRVIGKRNKKGKRIMNSAIERLLSLRVSNVMAQSVVDVSMHQTMSEAAALMVERNVSGVPVVDDAGHCVGLLSATDFVRHKSKVEAEEKALAGQEHELVHPEFGQPLHIDEVADDLVGIHMTAAVQTVHRDATLVEAGRIMCAEHVHRLPVVEESGQVVGLVSSLDIVAALVKAIEE